MLIAFLTKLQSTANKKNKKIACGEVKLYLETTNLSEDDITFIFEGNEELIGLCELSGKKSNFGKFKDSSLKIF